MVAKSWREAAIGEQVEKPLKQFDEKSMRWNAEGRCGQKLKITRSILNQLDLYGTI